MSLEAPRHPWLADFEREPVGAVGDLLAGYARVAPYERADAPDKARMLFGPLPADDPARRLLGPAILGWLDKRRRSSPPADLARLQRWVREICEAFEIVYLLEVAEAAVTLRRRYVTWHEWSARLSLSPARDVRADYWRMLALTQPLLQRAGLTNASEALMPLWLEICRQAGNPLPRHYLEIGLLGLRRLLVPTGSDAPFLAGLAHWAVAQNPGAAEFLAEWHGLKPMYPRTAARWCELVGNLLRTGPFQTRSIQAPAWWRGDPDFNRMARHDFRPKGVPWRSPRREEALAVVNRLEESWPLVDPAIEELMFRHRNFVERTGDSQFFVRAIHTVGSRLIMIGADAHEERALKAQALAREGLDWEPYNRHMWSLWRDALFAQGALEAAELVGWEFVRRDPDNVDGRNQLAKLLAEMSQPDQAAALLRDTIATFPQNVRARTQLFNVLMMQEPEVAVSALFDQIAAFPQDPIPRTQQAELLIAAGRLTDAEAAVNGAFSAGAVDAGTYALRARLQFNRERPLEAAATLEEGISEFPTNTVLLAHRNILASGRGLRLQGEYAAPPQRRPALAHCAPAPVADAALNEAMRFGRLRRSRFRAESLDPAERVAAREEVRSFLRDDPTFAYAELLAVRFGFADTSDALPNFALAFEQALATGDRLRMEELARRQPRLQALTLVGRAVLGDNNAARLIETLLHTSPEHDEARPVAVLRGGLQVILASATDLPAAVAANVKAIRHWLHEAVEASLGDRTAA
jgi:tetratricopeptide (TPR) repeat protein